MKFFRRRAQNPPSADTLLARYRRRFRVTLTVFLLFAGATAFYLWQNYDLLAFKHLIAQNYVDTEALDMLYRKELGKDPQGAYYSRFDNVVISVVTRALREQKGDKYTFQFTPERLTQYQQSEKEEAARTTLTEAAPGTGLLKLTNFSPESEALLRSNLTALQSFRNLIIDLRDNGGGDISVENRLASLFIPKGATIATDHFRLLDWHYKASGGTKLHYDRILILQNKNSASASEGLIAALRENLDNVSLVGETTFGKGIGQVTLPLKDGYAVRATVIQWLTPKGNRIHGRGITPDIPCDPSTALEVALSRLK